MRIIFEPSPTSIALDDETGYMRIPYQMIEKARLDVEVGPNRRKASLGSVFLSRVFGTDFKDYQQFANFTKIYGPLSFVYMIEDIRLELKMFKSFTKLYKGIIDARAEDKFIKRLYELITPGLFIFQDELSNFLRGDVGGKTTEERIRYLCRKAGKYGLDIIPYKTPDGDLFYYLSGRDFRSSILLLMADELGRKGKLPRASSGRCKFCNGPINPQIYDGIDYCSRKCANLGSKAKDDLKTLKDRIRKKAERKFKNNESGLHEFRKELNSIVITGGLESDIEKLCRRYGIDPKPGKPGRPPKKKPKAGKES